MEIKGGVIDASGLEVKEVDIFRYIAEHMTVVSIYGEECEDKD